MSINEIEQIVIRHVSGSKVNQIEQIPFVNLTEITIGPVIIATSMIPMATPKINAKRSNTDVLRHSWLSIENGGGGKQSETE